MPIPSFGRYASAALLTLVALYEAQATVVRFETVLGNIDVRLYQTATPLTTQNFLNYAQGGDWDDTFFHRSVPGFIVQGGGFKFTNAGGVSNVPQDPAVLNEPGLTNIRGTIAMAKLGGNVNSATNQWFFNLANNASNLDNQNGGFTVFGRVVGNGMTVADAIAALQRVNAGGAFTDLPVRNFAGGNILDENLVNVTRIRALAIPAGDYNFDGVVNAADYTIWQNSLGSTTAAEADGNGNGVVDLADYTVWRDSAGGASLAVSIPEPGAIALALAAMAGASRRRR